MLISQAKTYVLLAKLLKRNNDSYTHYLIQAKKCIELAKKIEQVDKTITMQINIAS